MKYIIAIIQPSKLEAVKEALSKVEVFRLTVSDVKGLGRQKGHTEVYRGHEYEVKLNRKAKFDYYQNIKSPTILLGFLCLDLVLVKNSYMLNRLNIPSGMFLMMSMM